MPVTHPSIIEIQDEGVSQGFVTAINAVGAGVVATVVSGVGILTIAGGGGGSATVTQVEVTCPYPAKYSHVGIIVTDAAVSPTSKIVLSLAGVAETKANSSDTVDMLDMKAVPGTGQFEFQASFMNPFGGPLTINYMVG
jgi:hypothetical protein